MACMGRELRERSEHSQPHPPTHQHPTPCPHPTCRWPPPPPAAWQSGSCCPRTPSPSTCGGAAGGGAGRRGGSATARSQARGTGPPPHSCGGAEQRGVRGTGAPLLLTCSCGCLRCRPQQTCCPPGVGAGLGVGGWVGRAGMCAGVGASRLAVVRARVSGISGAQPAPSSAPTLAPPTCSDSTAVANCVMGCVPSGRHLSSCGARGRACV